MDFPLLVGFGANSGEGAWSNPQPLRRDCPELLFLLLILEAWCSGHPKGGVGSASREGRAPVCPARGSQPLCPPRAVAFFLGRVGGCPCGRQRDLGEKTLPGSGCPRQLTASLNRLLNQLMRLAHIGCSSRAPGSARIRAPRAAGAFGSGPHFWAGGSPERCRGSPRAYRDGAKTRSSLTPGAATGTGTGICGAQT